MPEPDEIRQALLQGGGFGELCWYRPEFFAEEALLERWQDALARRGEPGHPSTLHVYVHVPFCRRRCRFCWYWSKALSSADQLRSYVRSVTGFVERFSQRVTAPQASNIYIGGGTPSILTAPLLDELLASLARTFSPAHEFCIESNPTSLDEDKIAVYGRHGVNRVSLGVQSFQSSTLASIGRQGVPAQRLGQLVAALKSQDILTNLDFQVSLPGQSADQVRRDLSTAFALGPDFITLYRYQTNPGLPQRGEAPLRYSEVVTARVLSQALRRGYLYIVQPGGDDGFSVVFVRLGRRGGHDLLRQLSYGAARWLGLPATAPIYKCFDERYAHLLGLGPGAFSRIYGGGWFRDVTSFERQAEGESPLYCGSSLSHREMGALEVLYSLARGRTISRLKIRRELPAADARELLAELATATSSGLVRSSFGRYRLANSLTAEQRERLLSGWLPNDPTPPSGVPGHEDRWHPTRRARLSGLLDSAASLGLNLDQDVQQSIIDVLQRYRQESRVFDEFVAKMDAPREGQELLGAPVHLCALDALYVQVEPQPAPPLGIAIAAAGENPGFAQTERFALIQVPRPGTPLTPAEEKWMEQLEATTRRLEADELG